MLRELTLPELEVVSGGTDQSTVVSTGTRRNNDGWISISTEEARRLFGDNGMVVGDPHGGMGVYGQMGGGSHSSPEGQDATPSEDQPACRPHSAPNDVVSAGIGGGVGLLCYAGAIAAGIPTSGTAGVAVAVGCTATGGAAGVAAGRASNTC